MRTLLLLAALAAAQDEPAAPPAGEPYGQEQLAPQSDAPSQQSPAPVTPAELQQPVPAAAPQKPSVATLDRPIRVKVHKEAKDWEPVGVRVSGDPHELVSFRWRLTKVKKKLVGESSPAKVTARLVEGRDEKRLIIAVFPRKLQVKRTHVELRLTVIEGYLERALIVAVTAEAGGGFQDDSAALKGKGVPFQEEHPAAGEIRLAAIDARASKDAFNSGYVRGVEFVEYNPAGFPGLGLVQFDYSVRGVRRQRH